MALMILIQLGCSERMIVLLVFLLVIHCFHVSRGQINCQITEMRHQTFKVDSGPDRSSHAPCVLRLNAGGKHTFELCVFHYRYPNISLTADWECHHLNDTDVTCVTKICLIDHSNSNITIKVTDACNHTFNHICTVTTRFPTQPSVTTKHRTTRIIVHRYSPYENHLYLLLVIPVTMGITFIGVGVLMYNEKLYCFKKEGLEKVDSVQSNATGKSHAGSGFNSSEERLSKFERSFSLAPSTTFETESDVDGLDYFRDTDDATVVMTEVN